MLAYPVLLADDDGTVLVTPPDFPELATFGDDREESLARAVEALKEAIAARIAAKEAVPTPSKGDVRATVPTLTAIRALLYQGMRQQQIG